MDGTTNAADLNLLALHWQESIPVAESLIVMAVPEPSWHVLALGAVIAILTLRSKEPTLAV